MLYNMSISDWHGSGAFGLRRLTVIAPWLCLGLAALFAALHRRHWSGPVLVSALAISWTTLLSWRYALYLIERDTGALRQLPATSFWLGRDILPLERLGDWIGSGFFATMLAAPRYGLPAGPPLALAALVAGLALSAVMLPRVWRRPSLR